MRLPPVPRDVSAIEVQPWGERSFYCLDLDGNRLCFVDETTLFLGRGAELVLALGSEAAKRRAERLAVLEHRRVQVAVVGDPAEHHVHREVLGLELRRAARPSSTGVDTGAPGRGRTE